MADADDDQYDAGVRRRVLLAGSITGIATILIWYFVSDWLSIAWYWYLLFWLFVFGNGYQQFKKDDANEKILRGD